MEGFRRHLTYANVMATLAVFLVVGGGAAYAANTVFSSDIVDNQVYSADVRDDNLTGGGLNAIDLRAGSVGSSEVRDDTLAGGGLTAADLQPSSINGPEIRNNQVRSADVRDDTLSGGGLTGADIANNTLGGADIDESTLGQVPSARLGGIGRGASPGGECDPDEPSFLTCAFTTIDLPAPTSVLVIGTVKAQPEPGGSSGTGQCRLATNLGTITTSGFTAGAGIYAKFVPLIGITFVGAGPMDFGIECNELDFDLTYFDARVAAVALSPS